MSWLKEKAWMIAAGLLLVMTALMTFKYTSVRLQLTQEQRDRAEDKRKIEQQAREQLDSELAKQNQRIADLVRISDEKAKERDQAVASAAAARTDRDRLRNKARDFAATACPASIDPSASGVSPAAPQAAGVLAELFGESADRYQGMGAAYDAACDAGSECEQRYDSLTRGQ